jgi:hypothetical protein
MVSGNESDVRKHSEFGAASMLVGGMMIVVQLGVLTAVFLGITDSLGIGYALAIPIPMYCVGLPLGLLAAIIGFLQPRRHRKYAKIGVALTLTRPLIFVLFFAVQIKFHPW